MRKVEAIEECKTLVLNSWSEGGITSYNEYNQFLCDVIGGIIPHLSKKGIALLKQRAEEVRASMPEEDRV